MKLGLLGGLAATTLVAMGGVASADAVYSGILGAGSDCPGCTVTVTTSGTNGSPTPYTPPTTLPFTPLNLGTGTGNGFQSNATINNPADSAISSISFLDGNSPGSGVYAGNSVGTALSPFGGDGASDYPADPLNNYLVAEGGGGSVTINYLSSQTSFDVLWGTVDTSPPDYNELMFTAGTQTITGADIAGIVGSFFSSADLDVAVQITGLNAFTTVKASDESSNAFEFDVAAPAPPIGRGLPALLAVGGMLLGVKLWGRGRKRFSFSAAA
jgi:hypothetical protein